MSNKPSTNTKIFGMRQYFDEIVDLYTQNKMPNKILLSGKKGLGKCTLAYHIINYIFSLKENLPYDKSNLTINNENKSYKLIRNNTHPNFFLIDIIDEKKSIDINQIRKMLQYSIKSSFNDKPRFILIDNIEFLNKNSVNALLKVIEEPNKNIFFILIYNNEKKILPTLKSRCLIFNIHYSFHDSVKISNLILDDDILKLFNKDLLNYYNTPGDIINLLRFSEEKKIDLKKYDVKNFLDLLIKNSYYKKSSYIRYLLNNFIELYFLKEYSLSKNKAAISKFYYDFLKKRYNTEKYNLDDESLFLEFQSKLLNE